jgi:hypothetical protein
VEFAKAHHDVPTVVADFAPQRLGGQLLWLPVHLVAEDESKQGRETITYSNFHRYAGEVKILDEAGPVVEAPE